MRGPTRTGGGFGKETDGFAVDQFFVEGIHYVATPHRLGYPYLVLNLDVSPRQWWTAYPGTSPPSPFPSTYPPPPIP